ncbi:MAG: hypothetical protein AAF985_10335, partial [Bacteroidota bacterium]
MDGLKSYLSIISPHLLNQVGGKSGQMIRLLREQHFLSEEVFKQRICQGKYEEAYYRSLKSKTIRILQALAIVSPPKDGSEVQKK